MRKSLLAVLGLAVAAGAVVAIRPAAPALGARAASARPAVAAAAATPRRPAVEFVPDRDESAAGVRFAARGRGSAAVVSATEVVLRVTGSTESGGDRVRRMLRHPGELPAAPPPSPPATAVRVEFVGAETNARLVGESPCSWRTNFFLGDDPSRWRRGVRTFRGVTASGVWPGVDVRWYERDANLEFDLVVAPGADAGRIAFAVSGAGSADRVTTRIDASGDLVMETDCGPARLRRPVAYEQHGSQRRPVDGRFVLGGTDASGRTAVTFAIGAHDPSATLVIDPAVVATYVTLGGSGTDQAAGIAADPSGHGAYLLCSTDSWISWFPTAQPLGATTTGDVDGVVVHVDDAGAILGQAVYGGSAADYLGGIAVGATGNVFVVGSTFSKNFPVTAGTVRGPSTSGTGVTVLRLTPTLDLDAATVYGGGSFEYGRGLALGAGDDVFVGGTSSSSDLVGTAGAYRPQRVEFAEAFLLRLDAALTTVKAFTFLGDANPTSVAILGDGDVGVAGYTSSTTFPVLNAAQPTFGGASDDGVVLKISPDATTLRYATYFGGAGNDFPASIAAIPAGAPWPIAPGGCIVAGTSDSTSVAGTARDAAHAGNDVYVGWFGADGTLSSVTFLGGAGNDAGGYVATTAHAAYVLGYTDSFTDFPLFYGTGGGTSDEIGWTLSPRADGKFDAATPGRIGNGGYEIPAGIAVSRPVVPKAAGMPPTPKLVIGVDDHNSYWTFGTSADGSHDHVVLVRLVDAMAASAGNVKAVVSHGTLKLTGDSAGDSVVIDKAASGNVTVSGVNGTTINGAHSVFQGIGVTNLAATTGAGNDSLVLHSLGFNKIAISTGEGDDAVTVAPNAVDPSAHPAFKIDTGGGKDSVSFESGTYQQSIDVHSFGDLRFELSGATVAARCDINGKGTADILVSDSSCGSFRFTDTVRAFDTPPLHTITFLHADVGSAIVREVAGFERVFIDSASSGPPVTVRSSFDAFSLTSTGASAAIDIGTLGLTPPTQFAGAFTVTGGKATAADLTILNTTFLGTTTVDLPGGPTRIDCQYVLFGRSFLALGSKDDEFSAENCTFNSPTFLNGGKGDNAIHVAPDVVFAKAPVIKNFAKGTGKKLTLIDDATGDKFEGDDATGEFTVTRVNPAETLSGTATVKVKGDGTTTFHYAGADGSKMDARVNPNMTTGTAGTQIGSGTGFNIVDTKP